MQKSILLTAIQREIQRHDLSYFVDEPPSVAHGGRGVVVAGCPACKKRINTIPQFMLTTWPNSVSRRDLFLAQKIEVGVTAGSRINDGRKVPGKVVGITVEIHQRKGKGDLQRDLGRADGFAVFPRLTVNHGLTARTNRIQERLAVTSKNYTERYHARKQ